MISVIILAGGIGSRVKSAIPKQYIEINDCPIIVHTIRNFEENPNIGNIVIVCLEQWVSYTQQIVEKYGFTKVKDIVVGGETGHISTRNGVYSLAGKLSDDDYVIIHDAARPIVSQSVINDLIDVAKLHDNACSAISCYETVLLTENRTSGKEQIDRNRIIRVQTPQCYKYGLIKSLYEKADRDDLHDFVYSNTMALHYGVEIFFSKGSNSNIKITTKEDIVLFKALLYYLDCLESEDGK
ncbi:MAG: 2-C-methyl-D-erythritol 4-phosphate cytidylyltransferase [Oscillospiraceae bacterium]|nr:2-C-methyl-D-erythritol 4-phosphate cytidylyltransferase [Oscillospiraceae bacterium]